MRSTLVLIATMALCTSAQVSLAEDVAPSADEARALQELGDRLTGWVVWESNRTGNWELYLMNADGSNPRQLTRLAQPGDARAWDGYMRPRFSPDGRTILFTYGRKAAPPETWVIPAPSGEPRRLCVGHPLNWTPDGKGVFLVRDAKLIRYDLASGQEATVTDVSLPADGGGHGLVGTARPDLGLVVLRTNRTNELFDMGKSEVVRTTGGCEPRFLADGRLMYWVEGPKDFRMVNLDTGDEHQVLGQPPNEPFNYTYFPTITDDGKWLLYGASPGQHDHDTSDYEVYIVRLGDWKAEGQPVRLTFNDRTDRWPDLYEGGTRLPAPPKPQVHLRASDRGGAVRLLFTFGDRQPGPGQDVPLSVAGQIRTPGGALSVDGPTTVATEDAMAGFVESCQRSGELTVAAMARPATLDQDGPARVVTLSADTGRRNFTLGQSGNRWVFRLRTTTTSPNGTPDFQAPEGSATTEPTHVVVTRDSEGVVRFYIDGEQVAERAIGGDLSGWDRGYRLALANELTGDRPWQGEIDWVSIESRCASAAEIRDAYQAQDAP
jgi:hypothetical protein